jgi:hypothetical protein
MADVVKRIASGKLNNEILEKEVDNILKQLNSIINSIQARITILSSGLFWLSGKGIPNNALGKDGDFYLDEITKNIYKKVAGNWL